VESSSAHGNADERTRVRVHVELEVEGEALSVDDDGHLHAVANPLRPGEVGPERASHRELVRLPSRGAPTQTMDFRMRATIVSNGTRSSRAHARRSD
jgi:hypothetical protein